MSDIQNLRARRATVDFSHVADLLKTERETGERGAYVPINQVAPENFETLEEKVNFVKVKPLEISAPPGGFQNAKIFDSFTNEARSVEDEMNRFSLDTLCASAFLIACPLINTRPEDYVLFFKLMTVGTTKVDVEININKVKEIISYMHCEKLDPYVEYSKASSDIGSKVLIRAMHDLFVIGVNAVKVCLEPLEIVPSDNLSASEVVVSVEDNIVYKNELEENRFNYVQTLTKVNHSTEAWSKLMQDKKYDLPDNSSGQILVDKPGISIGQVFPFGTAGRGILCVRALDELFGREGHMLVLDDKRNALFDPRSFGATEYNRVIPYGAEGDSMARCALAYGHRECCRAYVAAYNSLKSSSREDKRTNPIHDRFLNAIGFSPEEIAGKESRLVDSCDMWVFESMGIADVDAIRVAMDEGNFCVTYINTALQSRKLGVDFYPFLLDPGSFLTLLVPRRYSSRFDRKLLSVEKKLDNSKFRNSVYIGNLNHKNVKKLNDSLTKLTVYTILESYGVRCSNRIEKLFSDKDTPLDKFLRHVLDYIHNQSKRSWHYILVPSYGAKFLLEADTSDEANDSEVSSEFSDDSDSEIIGDPPYGGGTNSGGTITSVDQTTTEIVPVVQGGSTSDPTTAVVGEDAV